MSAKPTTLDSKVRWTLTVVGLTVLLLIGLALWNYISRMSDHGMMASPISTDERLISVDGRTMLVEPEALPHEMMSWVQSRKGESLSFELSDRSFLANSTAPSRVTVDRITQVAGVVKTSPNLTVHIVRPAHFESAAIQRLDDQRAVRLRDALLAKGVRQTQVTIDDGSEDLPISASPYLSVLLTK